MSLITLNAEVTAVILWAHFMCSDATFFIRVVLLHTVAIAAAGRKWAQEKKKRTRFGELFSCKLQSSTATTAVAFVKSYTGRYCCGVKLRVDRASRKHSKLFGPNKVTKA